MPNLEVEQELFRQGYLRVVGVDEAGRGPLAGPVVAGAAVMPSNCSPDAYWLSGINDSKVLTARQRQESLKGIEEHAAIAVGMASAAEIDEVGIGRATRWAMIRAIQSLLHPPDYILVDFVPLPESGIPFLALTHGDKRCYSIAAASIVAKVTRDRLMEQVDREFPAYRFASHKGYPTPEHLKLLSLHGPSPIHRRSFAPVKSRLISRWADQ